MCFELWLFIILVPGWIQVQIVVPHLKALVNSKIGFVKIGVVATEALYFEIWIFSLWKFEKDYCNNDKKTNKRLTLLLEQVCISNQ